MKQHLILLIVLLLAVCCNFFRPCHKAHIGLNLGSNIFIDSMLGSDSVIAYLLDPESLDTTPKLALREFEVIMPPVKLSKFDKEQMFQFIQEPIYVDSLISSCTFLPDIGFKFFKDKKETDLLIAFYCDEWFFANDRISEISTCTHVRLKLITLSKSLFPEHLKHLR